MTPEEQIDNLDKRIKESYRFTLFWNALAFVLAIAAMVLVLMGS